MKLTIDSKVDLKVSVIKKRGKREIERKRKDKTVKEKDEVKK